MLQAQTNKWWLYPSLGVDMGGAVPFPLSDIPDGSKGTPKLTPSLGIGFGRCLSERWNLGVEINYHVLSFSAAADVRSQPFYSDDHLTTMYFTGPTKTDAEFRFVEFPLVAMYAINSTWSITPGVYYSRILEGTFNTSGINGVTSIDKNITDNAALPGIANPKYSFDEYLDNWDVGMLLGFRYNLTQKVCFWGRMQAGFKSIFIKEFDNIEYEMYQMRVNVGASVNLFDR